jgi:hypothetical protein
MLQRWDRAMLQPMQPAAESGTAPSFASLLASLTGPAHKPTPAWDDNDLADDVTSLSYETALRAHARYRAAGPGDRAPAQDADPEERQFEPGSLPHPGPSPDDGGEAQTSASALPEAHRPLPVPQERNLKSASITIRMSQAECAQLHQRAAEAGLTVSAYLRSCTLEAESLRALVKQTMAQLRSSAAGAQPTLAPPRPPWRQRMMRLFASGPKRQTQRRAWTLRG